MTAAQLIDRVIPSIPITKRTTLGGGPHFLTIDIITGLDFTFNTPDTAYFALLPLFQTLYFFFTLLCAKPVGNTFSVAYYVSFLLLAKICTIEK